MNKDLRIDNIRNTMNKDNLHSTLHKLFYLVLEYDDENQWMFDRFISCFGFGEVTKINTIENEDKISQNGEIKSIEDIRLNYYYSVSYNDDEVEINNIIFDDVEDEILDILQDIEDKINKVA